MSDPANSGAVHRAVGFHGILSHIARVGHLLGKYYNVETHIHVTFMLVN